MQKQDYIHNARGEGVSQEILGCFYENISYTPFIHVEDELNLGARLMPPKSRKPLFKVPSSDQLTRGSREPVDPYALVLDGKLDSLRPNLKDVMEMEDVYSFWEPENPPDIYSLHSAFYKPCVLQIVSARSRPDAFLNQSSIDNPAESHPGLVDIRVAKVGLLWRKEMQKKKTRSPWQEWGAILTGSQLYLFRDVQWVKSLISQYEEQQRQGRHYSVTFKPPLTDFRPDGVMSTHDAVALLDSSYKKHKHAFLFVRHGGLEEVFLSNSESEMKDWIAILNYAAAFRTTGVRMRGMIGTQYEGRRLGRSNSTTSEASIPTVCANNRRIDPALVEEVSTARRELMHQRIEEATEKLRNSQHHLDELLRNARHLQILAPIHPKTRDQVVLGAGRISAKLKWARLDIWRTRCHKELLSLDLSDEEHSLPEGKSKHSTLRRSISGLSQQTQTEVEAPSNDSLASPESNRLSSAVERAPNLSAHSTTSLEQMADSTNQQMLGGKSVASEHSLPVKTSLSDRKPCSRPSSPSNIGGASVLPREASIASSTSKKGSAIISSSNDLAAIHCTSDNGEERILKESGIASDDASSFVEKGPDMHTEHGIGEHRGKVRRSLHRTLREAHHIHQHHHRNKREKDPKTTTASGTDDGSSVAESEGLSRTTDSFTVHGKKASVITFGSEWQDTPLEQRLKMRKPAQGENPSTSDMLGTDDGTESLLSEPSYNRRAHSLRTPSATTLRSQRRLSAPADAPILQSKSESGHGESQNQVVDPLVEEGTETRQSPRATASSDNIATHSKNSNDENTKSHNTRDDLTQDEERNLLVHTVSQETLNRFAPEQAVSA